MAKTPIWALSQAVIQCPQHQQHHNNNNQIHFRASTHAEPLPLWRSPAAGVALCVVPVGGAGDAAVGMLMRWWGVWLVAMTGNRLASWLAWRAHMTGGGPAGQGEGGAPGRVVPARGGRSLLAGCSLFACFLPKSAGAVVRGTATAFFSSKSARSRMSL